MRAQILRELIGRYERMERRCLAPVALDFKAGIFYIEAKKDGTNSMGQSPEVQVLIHKVYLNNAYSLSRSAVSVSC